MAFGQTLGSKGMFSLLIFTNSWHNIHLSFSFHFQPLHLSLVAIAAAALPSFVLPNCLVYWTFLASFGFFGLVSTPIPKNPLTNTSSGDRVPCRLHLPRPCLSSWSACALPCFWTGQSPPPSFTQDCNCSVADIHNQSSGDRLPWSGSIVRSPKRRSRLGNIFLSQVFFSSFQDRR